MPFPEHLETHTKPLQLRMVGNDEISQELLFDLSLAEDEGYYVAKNGELSFYIAAQEIDRLMGKKMPHWELV